MENPGSTALAALRLAAYLTLTFALMPVQALLLALGGGTKLSVLYHRLCARILGFDVRVRGTPVAGGPVLFASNHISYLDITVLGGIAELSFVAKSDVARWPLFGWLAKLQRTVFVDRRASNVGRERDNIARRLDEGGRLVLFPEGTTGDGNRTRRFKSALFAVAERPEGAKPVMVQPVTIAWTRLDGMPMGRVLRPAVAWYGDMDLAPHLWEVAGLGRIEVEVIFHAPLTLAEAGSRKALAQHCESVISRSLTEALAGRQPAPLPTPSEHAKHPAPLPA
jgi:1-acyl-sn-glycerol-3-phosphate acyltransferase